MGLIIHIPHSSRKIPSYEGYTVSRERVHKEAQELCDLFTDEIFDPGDLDDCDIVKAEFSRVFCDVERFLDERKEHMNKYGMGIVYEKDSYAEPFRKVNKQLKHQIIDKYYTPHHEKVSDLVAKHLLKYNEALIIDCHSFPDLPKYYMDYGKHKAPDICLSNCDYGFSMRYMLAASDYFKNLGYSVSLHAPFKGAFIPNQYYRNNFQTMSVMIELNKRIYMDEKTCKKNSSSVKRLNKEIKGLYKHLMKLQEI